MVVNDPNLVELEILMSHGWFPKIDLFRKTKGDINKHLKHVRKKNKNLEEALDYLAYGLNEESRQTRTIRNQIKKIEKAIKGGGSINQCFTEKSN